MAKFNINESIAPGVTVDVLTNWNFQTPEKPGTIKLNMFSTVTGLFATLQSLDQTIFQDSPVSGGGVAGVLPTDFTVEPIVERVPGGRKLSLRVRNTTGGALPFLATIDYVGGGGGKRR